MPNRARFPASRSRIKNRILSALADDEYRSISRHLSFVELKQGRFVQRGQLDRLCVLHEQRYGIFGQRYCGRTNR